MEIIELFHNWEFNKRLFASKIKMLPATFVNKISKDHTTKFKAAELVKLINVLRILEKDIHNTIKSNWVPDQEREKICPSCEYENNVLTETGYKCKACATEWLPIQTKSLL